MDDCLTCKSWICQRVMCYGDGSTVIKFETPEGRGECTLLKIETTADFGCKRFIEGRDHIEVLGHKAGSPWQYFTLGPCPDCKDSAGPGWMCRRCAGTAKVRYYDDGFVGDEQTKRHPKEPSDKVAAELLCIDCGSPLDQDWIACPRCGARTNKSEEMVIIEGEAFNVGGGGLK
jgi:hypothetical protein